MKQVKAFQSELTGKLFPTEAEARKDENQFGKGKIEKLRSRIEKGKPWTPVVGDMVYVPTSLYIDHGEDDVEGGLAQVTRVYEGMSGGDPHTIFIDVAQHPNGYNWSQFLSKDQAKLMRRFGNQIAYPDPDV